MQKILQTKHKAIFWSLIFCLCLLLCVSCRNLVYGPDLAKKLDEGNAARQEELDAQTKERNLHSQVLRRFSHIRNLINERDLDRAEAELSEMRSLEEYQDEINGLQDLINMARRLSTDDTTLALDRQQALNEAAERMKLPDNYNTVVRKNHRDEYKVETNSLEELLDKPVSMKVDNIPLEEFAMQLGKLEGLNLVDPLNVIFSNDSIKSKTFTANFKEVPLKEIFKFISRNLGADFNVVDNLIWITPAAAQNSSVPLETQIITLKHGIIPTVPEGIAVDEKMGFATTAEIDDDLETALKAFFAKSTTGGSYTLFKTRNMLLINDTRANIKMVEELVKALDKPPYQVVIEARFLTVSQSDLRDVGVELRKHNGGRTGEELDPSTTGDLVNLSDFGTSLESLTLRDDEGNFNNDVGGMTISGILGNRSFDVLLTAIENKDSTIMVSAPRVTTLNNRTARIRKGDKKYYFEQYTVQSVSRGDAGTDQILVPSGKPTPLNLGITFDVKVNVGNDGRTILLGLKPEIIDFKQWECFTSSSAETVDKKTQTVDTQVYLPYTAEQTIAASVAIHSGETVILGGMVENTTQKVVTKIPILGDIPWLGFLFRHTKEVSQPANLLIFVTATVINEEGKYVIVEE